MAKEKGGKSQKGRQEALSNSGVRGGTVAKEGTHSGIPGSQKVVSHEAPTSQADEIASSSITELDKLKG